MLLKIHFSSLSQPGSVIGRQGSSQTNSVRLRNINSHLTKHVAVNAEYISIVFKSLKIVASVILACDHTII